MGSASESPAKSLRPQPGRQTQFLSSSADIVVYGGAAGGGKSYGLKLEPARHVGVDGFAAVLLRRTSKQLTKAGGLWDKSREIYPHLGGKEKSTKLTWNFPSGAKISMGHIEHDKDLASWDGSQICLLMFDQLEAFTERMFFYMLSRNRSTCGVAPYVRASCNPRANWLAKFLAWWIDADTGFARLDRAGKVRWMVRAGKGIEWFDSQTEAVAYCVANDLDEETPKSVSFIPARLEDNKILLKQNPGYKANLLALPEYERRRLYEGNWHDRPEGGEFPEKWLKDKWFEKWPTDDAIILKTLVLDPSKGKSDKTGDYSAFIKLAIDRHDTLYVQADLKRRPIDEMVSTGCEIYTQFQPTAFGLEGNAWQDLLQPDFAEEFSRRGIVAPEVWLLNNHVNKDVRIRRLAGYLAHDRIRFKADCPDTQLLIDQLLDFPAGQHDDGPDALEMAIRLAEQLSTGVQA